MEEKTQVRDHGRTAAVQPRVQMCTAGVFTLSGMAHVQCGCELKLTDPRTQEISMSLCIEVISDSKAHPTQGD